MGTTERRPCEAETHHKNCACQTCIPRNCARCPLITDDHFTAKSIAKQMGWSRAQVNDEENRQWLSPACHVAKDRSTPLRKVVAMRQISGENLTFEQHQAIFKKGKY